MNVLQQVPRNALVWGIICLFALVAPHAVRLPFWVLGVYLLAVGWRWQVYRGRWSFPRRKLKLAMIVSSFVGIYFSYGSFIGLEPTVALLLTAFALKFTELAHRQDAYVLIFLGYFVCLTEFLFSQDLLMTFYSLLCVTLLTTTLVALHQPGQHQFNRRTIRLAFVMLLQALPLMVVLFFLFPRIGPLWKMPTSSHTGTTGMSDFMKPGDIASLTQSDEVAFRVKFEGEIPPSSDLYWRGLVMSKLENGAWSTLGLYSVPAKEARPQAVSTTGDPLIYSVIMEPTNQQWLYGLRYAISSTPGVMATSDFRLISPTPVEVEYIYRARSWTGAELEPKLSEWRRKIETRLPPNANPRSRAFALEMRDAVESDAAFMSLIMNKFTTETYVYTLKPGQLLGRDAIDQFLFESRRGFCEHYASAFVFMMRAAGIPARVVAGYQGGEVNPVNKTVIVHQFDAHAWAEVWIKGRGWVRADPTAAVSPTRIEMGLEEAMESEGSFLSEMPLSPVRYRSVALLNELRLRYDALTYGWQSWVVGFDSGQQMQLLHRVFGEISARTFMAAFIGSWALVLIPVAISLFRGKDTFPMSPADKYYRMFCHRLSLIGLKRVSGEAPGDFARRVVAAIPEESEQVWNITSLYARMAYETGADGNRNDQNALEELIRAVSKFKPKAQRNAGGGLHPPV